MKTFIEPIRSEKGQALIESVFSISIATILTVGSLTIVSRALSRIQCLNRFFDFAHSQIYLSSSREVDSTRVCGAKSERLRFRTLKNDAGTISIYLSLWLGVIVFAMIGVLLIIEKSRRSVALQLTLDSCAGEYATDFARALNHFESLNQKVKLTRATLALGQALPPARAALSAALVALSIEQTRVAALWKMKEIAWLARTSCSRAASWASSAPSWPFRANLPDSLGPTPWTPTRKTHSVLFYLSRKNRIAGAEVYDEKNRYQARWKLPRIPMAEISQKLAWNGTH